MENGLENSVITTVAKRLRIAERDSMPIEPVRDIEGLNNIDLAYEIQGQNIYRRIEKGDIAVGKKIGLTSKAVQEQLGVDQPDVGILLKSMQLNNGDSVQTSELILPKVEGEIAFVLRKDLVNKDNSMEDLIDAIDHCMASIEIVDSRIIDWNIKILDTVSDNASSARFVLADETRSIHDVDLENCSMTLFKNNHMVSEGIGSACLGNPLNALKWLADFMVTQENPLRAGEIILSGAVGPFVNANAGDTFHMTISGLGSCSVKFI